MKKTAKILTMILALGLGMSTMACALGEGEELGAAVQSQEIPKSVEVEMVEGAPEIDAIAEAQVETAVEAPVEAPVEQPVEAPAEQPAEVPAEQPVEQPVVQAETEEKTEVGSEESVAEPVEEPAEEPAAEELTEIEDLETPLGLFDSNTGFVATATVQRKGEGALYYGDMVTLTAQVSNANRLYAIRWEVNCQDDEGWKTIPNANGLDYSFMLTRDNANYEYRVVLVAAA